MSVDRPVLSLLDRLIDDDPTVTTEIVDEAEEMRRLKQGLRRDLEGLLNARRPFGAWFEAGRGLDATVIGYGLADVSTEDFASAAVRERVRRLIAQCIRLHEPRLHRVEVEVGGEPTSAGINFRISATMRIDLFEEQIVYDARLRPVERSIAVSLGR